MLAFSGRSRRANKRRMRSLLIINTYYTSRNPMNAHIDINGLHFMGYNAATRYRWKLAPSTSFLGNLIIVPISLYSRIFKLFRTSIEEFINKIYFWKSWYRANVFDSFLSFDDRH